MKTQHRLHVADARRMAALATASVDLVVTSPPYPMISMWDDLFIRQDEGIADELAKGRGREAFARMHGLLDPVWQEVFRVLKPGGFACINIGDATRTLHDDFALFPNHARILDSLTRTGFTILPDILWRKQTNAPNKFMGSGMLPAGAYVTLEHEYILIARKGSKRVFATAEEKRHRRASALFWEERNLFFSDVWMDVKGASQVLAGGEARARSAAYPFEVAYRLINMYSVKEDLVLDPFWGTGTTTAAAMAAGRNSVGLEIDPGLARGLEVLAGGLPERVNTYIENRLAGHVRFVAERIAAQKAVKYRNRPYGFPVVTAQEQELLLNPLSAIEQSAAGALAVRYGTTPQAAFCRDWGALLPGGDPAGVAPPRLRQSGKDGFGQLKLF